MKRRWHLLISLILLLIALALRLLILVDVGFDGLYGQDAYAYYDFAVDILDAIRTGATLPPFFWSLGYPAQLAFGFALFGISEQVALSLNLTMGALLPVLVYGLALQLKLKAPYAFLAALLMVVSGQILQSGLVIMSDIPALFWAILSCMALVAYLDSAKRQCLLYCVVAFSIAYLTRWMYLILLPIYGLVVLLHWKRLIVWRDVIYACGLALILALPQIAFNVSQETTFLSHSLHDWSLENAAGHDLVNIEGTFHYEKLNAIFYAAPMLDVPYLAPLLSPFILLGFLAYLKKGESVRLVLLSLWMLLPYLFLIGIPYQNIRYPLMIFPMSAILIGYALQVSFSLKYIKWLMLSVVMVGLWQTANSGVEFARSFVARQQAEKAIVNWLNERLPDGATVYTFGTTLTLEHYTTFNTIEIFYETPATLAQRRPAEQQAYLLLNVWQIENQWDGRIPQTNYHWFYEVRGLRIMDRFHNTTLFELDP